MWWSKLEKWSSPSIVKSTTWLLNVNFSWLNSAPLHFLYKWTEQVIIQKKILPGRCSNLLGPATCDQHDWKIDSLPICWRGAEDPYSILMALAMRIILSRWYWKKKTHTQWNLTTILSRGCWKKETQTQWVSTKKQRPVSQPSCILASTLDWRKQK